MGYCILPDGGLGFLSTILGSWTDFTFQDWQAGRNDNEWLPCYGGGDGADRACAVSRSAGRQNHPTCPPENGSQRGVHLDPGSPGCTCQGIKAPCDGLSVCPPVLPVLAVQPVTPSCRDPREQETGPRKSGVRSGRRDVERETVSQSMRSACARGQREGATCGTARYWTYIAHM